MSDKHSSFMTKAAIGISEYIISCLVRLPVSRKLIATQSATYAVSVLRRVSRGSGDACTVIRNLNHEKIKFTLEQDMKAQSRSRSIVLLFL